MGASLLGALGGCKFDDNRNDFTDSKLYKKLHPAEIKSSVGVTDALTPPADLPMGGKADSSAHAAPINSAAVQDAPYGQAKDGEHAGGWTGMYDVYWKLNWARKELLAGNVPHDLADVIVSTRKHCKRLADEFPKLEGMDERLACANSALDHLESGLKQMNNLAILEDSGLQWRAMPWGLGVDEMHRYLERMGLVGSAPKASFSVSTPLIENDDPVAEIKQSEKLSDARPYVTSRQRDAIALALRCEGENHSSPEELARKQFHAALQDTIEMRDLCGMAYHPYSVPGDDTVISGSLHLEAGGGAQTPRRFEPPDKSAVPGFDPAAPPGPNHQTPLVR